MTPPDAAREAGREALAQVDAVLAGRPHRDGDALSHATRALCAMRDARVAEGRAGDAARDRLEALNAVLGVVLGVRFPVGPVAWDDLEAARGWLAGLVEEQG